MYCQVPSGTLDSVQVIVVVPEQLLVTRTAEPLGTGYRRSVYCPAGIGVFPVVVDTRPNENETVLLFGFGETVGVPGVAPVGNASAFVSASRHRRR